MTANDHFEKGKVLYEAENYEGALEAFEIAISLDPSSAEYWTEKSRVLSSLHQSAEAMDACEKAIGFNPDYAPAWRKKGDILSDSECNAEALEAYDTAILLDPYDAKIHANRGCALLNLGHDTEALEACDIAIMLDPNSAAIHANRGATLHQLGRNAEALEACNTAILLDPDLAVTYVSQAKVLSELGRNEEALEASGTAIRLDLYDARPWSEKARIEFERGAYELAKLYIVRAFHLKNSPKTAVKNFLLILSNSKSSASSFLAFRAITTSLSPDHYGQFSKIIIDTFQQSIPLSLYLSYHELQHASILNTYQWYKWLAIINYRMGDPLTSFRLLKELVETNEGRADLMAWYYLMLSCLDFVEDTEPFMDKVFDLAVVYCDKVPTSKNEKLQQYYAGLILLMDDEMDNALCCLLPIVEEFLPASFIALQILHMQGPHEQRDEVLDIIIQKEEEIETGFLVGLEPQQLDLENGDLEAVFSHACHYKEIELALETVRDLVEEEIPASRPFYELWQLSEDDQKKVLELIREYLLQHLYGELFIVRKEKLQAIRSKLTQEQYTIMEEQMKQEPRIVRLLMDEMEQGISKNQLESYLGEHIQEFSLSDEKYFQLICYYFLKDNLNEYQQFLLETYTVLQSVTKKMPNELWLVGMKDGMKGTVGDSLGIITGTVTSIIIPSEAIHLKASAAVLTGLAVKSGTAVLVDLALKWFKDHYSKPMNFKEFKKGFELFLAEEKEQLGEEFENKYPLHGFKELIVTLSEKE